MKCPYRKVIIDLKSMGLDGTEEQFADCYGTECPWYVGQSQSNFGLIVPEYCRRTDVEYFSKEKK